MVLIEEILRLPKEEQLAIVEAIQDNLDNFGDEEDSNVDVSEEIIAFMEERMNHIEATNQPTYTWQQVEENLKNRWNTK